MNDELIFFLVGLTVIILGSYIKKYIQRKKNQHNIETHSDFIQSLFVHAQNPEVNSSITTATNHFEDIKARIKNYFHLNDIFSLTLNIDNASHLTNFPIIQNHPLISSYIEHNHSSIVSELETNQIISRTINQLKTNNQYNIYITQDLQSSNNQPQALQLIVCLQTQALSNNQPINNRLTEEELIHLAIALDALCIATYHTNNNKLMHTTQET